MPFDYQPTLKGTLLELRPLRQDDFDDLFAVASDPLIWEQHPEPTRWTPKVFRRFFDDAIASGGALIALDAQTQEVIGSSRFFDYDEATGEVEIGWSFLALKCWGGRYNGEMKDLMLRHAFRFARVAVFLIGPKNIRSQKAIQKIGGVRDGSRFVNGRDNYIFTITAPDLQFAHVDKADP